MIYFETLNVYQDYIAIAIKELCGENSIFTYISRYKYFNNPGYSNFTCTSTNSAKKKPFFFLPI